MTSQNPSDRFVSNRAIDHEAPDPAIADFGASRFPAVDRPPATVSRKPLTATCHWLSKPMIPGFDKSNETYAYINTCFKPGSTRPPHGGFSGFVLAWPAIQPAADWFLPGGWASYFTLYRGLKRCGLGNLLSGVFARLIMNGAGPRCLI